MPCLLVGILHWHLSFLGAPPGRGYPLRRGAWRVRSSAGLAASLSLAQRAPHVGAVASRLAPAAEESAPTAPWRQSPPQATVGRPSVRVPMAHPAPPSTP